MGLEIINRHLLRFISINTKCDLPMQDFTQDDLRPHPATLLFVKQFARMCNSMKNKANGYNSISVIACC